jgi:hypothetical protein
MHSPLQRLYKTKLALLATIVTFVGIAIWILAHVGESVLGWSWLGLLLVPDVGAALFTTGLIGIFFEFMNEQDAEERANQRLRTVLKQEAPAIRDAVIQGFAFEPEELAKVASPKVLDQIVRNSLGLQLGDRGLADDIYTDIREQVLHTAERQYDMRASVSLAPWDQGPATGRGSMFVATTRREYRVAGSSPVLRFACVSEQADYDTLLRDPSITEVWYFEPIGELTASSPEAFELLQFQVNGQPRPVRRTKRAGMQVFTADTGVDDAEVQISYTYRVLLQRHGHALYLDFGQPCKGVQVDFWYQDCGIRYVNVLDFIASSSATRVLRSPKEVPTPNVSVGFDDWVWPKSGVVFVWVLDDEIDKR